MSRYKDSKRNVGRGYGDISTTSRRRQANGYNDTTRRGVVATPNGFVRVYSREEKGTPVPEVTRLWFIDNDGNETMREYMAFHGEAFLVTLAKRFAAEMAGGK